VTENKGSYAEVNGLEMYYEIHGTGHPLVVLHGAYMTIETMGEIVSSLAETRQVIAVELQGHGHTADIDRPLSYEQMADDVTALLAEISIEKADVFGYSMGGGVALQIAVRHPEVMRKLVVASASSTSDGMYPELLAMIPTITPEVFAGSPIEEAYLRTAPNPEDFPQSRRQAEAIGHGALRLAARGHPGDRVAHTAHSRGLRRHPPRARGRAVPATWRRRDGRSRRSPQGPARRAPRHHALRSPRLCGLGPRRLAAFDDRRVPRRAYAKGTTW
jgi:pimeloyl-ACP methyl ester carboxylesterase